MKMTLLAHVSRSRAKDTTKIAATDDADLHHDGHANGNTSDLKAAHSLSSYR